MKAIYKKLLFLLLFLPLSLLAQNKVTGVVVDKKSNQPIPGVNVKGELSSASTDFDGKFVLSNAKKGERLVFSYLGYKNTSIVFDGQKTISVSMEEDAQTLNEVVVQVGYGTVKKKDATGSVSVISSKDFNKGAIVSVDQLLSGKAAGVRITSEGGQPDAAPNIRIRGGSSLSASNNPLIIIDGVAISDVNPAGVSNPFTLVNPNDIESFSVLKDASATAIYGVRASNGVIIITTKKGSSGAPQYNYSSTYSFGNVAKKIDVMDGNEFKSFIEKFHPTRVNDLGVADPNDPTKRIYYNTNWQDEIYRNTFSTDHTFSARANLYKKIPFRASIGYNRTEGVVRGSDYERFSYSMKMTPKFWDDHLKVDINAKGTYSDKNAVDEGGAIGNAVNFDPTKPVFSSDANNRFGKYYQNVQFLKDPNDPNGGFYSLDGLPRNPVALLEQRTRPERVLRFLGNVEFDYKAHFLPELHAIVNLGYDASASRVLEYFSDNALATYQRNQDKNDVRSQDKNTNYVFNPGVNYIENQTGNNRTMDAYLTYSKKLNGVITKVDAQAGYAYQDFVNDGNKVIYQYNQDTGLREENVNPQNLNNRYYLNKNLQAFFARANVDFYDKYLLTMTMRADASSLFAKDKRWGYFPSFGFAWKAKEESFLKNVDVISDLKVRLGWGKTGQEGITGAVGYYPSRPLFVVGNSNSNYLPGYNLYSALPFNPNITWETTSTANVGLDFELFEKGVLSGSFDLYSRKTNDLLAVVAVAPGQGLKDEAIGNVGSTESHGFEFNLNIKPVQTKDWNVSVTTNIGYNKGKVTDLNGIASVKSDGGSLPSGTGVQLGYHAVGEQPHSAWVFQQVYDQAGNPIPNAFVDRNNDGKINESDRYYVALRPNWTYGFGLNVGYKKFDLTANFRGQLGGQMYNARVLTNGWTDHAKAPRGAALNNVLDFDNGNSHEYIKDFNTNGMFSDYLLEDATFLRCDNISLGYKFDKFVNKSSLRVYGAVNNAFILTKYSGQDPENFNGIDNNFYPRPRVYSVGLSLDF